MPLTVNNEIKEDHGGNLDGKKEGGECKGEADDDR
jgi:hypothetical protein